jgi:hypothetical protein
MKVEISRDTCNRIKLTTKKHKKIAVVSLFEEDEVNLKSDYLDSDSIEYVPPFYYIESAITVTWAKNRVKIVDLLKEIDEEESSISAYGENITTYRDIKAFKLDLIVYRIPSACDEI